LPENNVGNTHYFSTIISVSPTASRIKETKDAYVRISNKLQYLAYLLLHNQHSCTEMRSQGARFKATQAANIRCNASCL